MASFPSDPVLPIVILPLEGGKVEEPRRADPPDLRHWQIEEFLRQTGKAENTQRTYRGQLVRFAAWCDKSWLDVTPSDIGKYRRELKLEGTEAHIHQPGVEYAAIVLPVAAAQQWLPDESAIANGCDQSGAAAGTPGRPHQG